jgi:hypothetical protein
MVDPTRRNVRAVFCLIFCHGAAALSSAAPVGSAAPTAAGEAAAAAAARSVGWWWDCPEAADDPKVEGMIAWAKEHKTIVSTIMMNCGVQTCAINYSAPRGGNFSCLNNGGVGGTITGELKDAGKRVLKELVPLGVKVELWLGEDDSRQSALHMFSDPAALAKSLLGVAAANPGLTGFNIDMETAHSTPADAILSVPFLREVTQTLNANTPALRFTTDVSCASADHGYNPMIDNCALIASSGVNRMMHMGTYNAVSYPVWYSQLAPALSPNVPRASIGLGLGVWLPQNDPWSESHRIICRSPKSQRYR